MDSLIMGVRLLETPTDPKNKLLTFVVSYSWISCICLLYITWLCSYFCTLSFRWSQSLCLGLIGFNCFYLWPSCTISCTFVLLIKFTNFGYYRLSICLYGVSDPKNKDGWTSATAPSKVFPTKRSSRPSAVQKTAVQSHYSSEAFSLHSPSDMPPLSEMGKPL